MNADILKGKMKENRKTQEDVASSIGISLSRFNAKINGTGGAEFTLGELRAIKRTLNLDSHQMDIIFFD